MSCNIAHLEKETNNPKVIVKVSPVYPLSDARCSIFQLKDQNFARNASKKNTKNRGNESNVSSILGIILAVLALATAIGGATVANAKTANTTKT